MLAAIWNHLELVKRLMAAGADIHVPDKVN
jgi:hypothetical protein